MSGRFFLSHPLSAETPGFGGAKDFVVHPQRRISRGDSSNSDRWELSNHIGTHIDAPYHFCEEGNRISDFAADFWFFDHPHLVDLPKLTPDLIGPELDKPDSWANKIPMNCDLLLIRTGFEAQRAKEAYWSSNPGLSAELAVFLRAHRPSVRAVGMDFISTTSFKHREAGREAHRAFLNVSGAGHPILLIEDMKLSPLTGAPVTILVSPLRVDGADGAPVTVIAEIKKGI